LFAKPEACTCFALKFFSRELHLENHLTPSDYRNPSILQGLLFRIRVAATLLVVPLGTPNEDFMRLEHDSTIAFSDMGEERL
jgi:hypothetical protein